MSAIRQPCLLQVPFELRRQIYDAILCLPTRDHLSLLSTCRRIHNEARIYLYRRHIVLNSQRALYLFVRQSGKAMLEQVTTLTLHLEDARPEEHLPVLGQLANERLAFGSPSHPLYREYQAIIMHLEQLPAVVALSILPPKGRTSYPPPDLVEGILKFACIQWPNLSSLTLLLENVPLTFLTQLREVTALHLTGFSPSNPQDAVEILSCLPHLSSLYLTGPEARPQYESKIANRRRIVHSLTSSTVRRTSTLRSLAVSEKLDRSRNTPVFMNSEMLGVIRDQLAVNLVYLKIAASMALDQDTITDIGNLLCAAQSLETVDIGWYNIEPGHEVLEKLPQSVTTVRVALPSSKCSWSTVGNLKPSLNRLIKLQRLDLCVIDEDRVHGLPSLGRTPAWRQLLDPSNIT